MFVQALAAYADTHLKKQLDDAAFEERAVPYFIEIGADGGFLSVRPRFREEMQPNGKTKPRQMTYCVPRSPVNRNAGLYPLLGADAINYVVGAGPWTKPEEQAKHSGHHQAFVALVNQVARETSDEALAACSRFYEQPAEVEKARAALAAAAPGSNVALYVGISGGVVTDREPVQAWWRRDYAAKCVEAAAGTEGECLISGVVGPIPPTHPKIKHAAALGGQAAGVSLMSFDKPAFRSYGWEQNANSPVSADRAMAYVLALNELLRPGGDHRKDFGGVAFLFWLRKDSAENPVVTVQQRSGSARVTEVKNLLNFSRSADPDPDHFYMAAVSANGGRLILRSWITETLPVVLENMLGWWDALEIQPLARDQQASAPAFFQLLYAIDRTGEPPPDRVVALLRRALEGRRSPLGYRFVNDALQRMRVDKTKRMDLAALGLLRLCLNDLHHATGKGESMSASLDENQQHPAYLCGQLLAIHDYLQYKTFDTAGEQQPNSTVADRFYTLVMNAPAVGMEKVFTLGRKHLSKLRKLRKPQDPEAGANAAFGIEQQIARIERALGADVPMHFGMHDKARFALGFYHQKAYRPRKTADQADDATLNPMQTPVQKESDQ